PASPPSPVPRPLLLPPPPRPTLFPYTTLFRSVTVGPPPCIFRARIVATRTAQLGLRPLVLHLMSTNFSHPMSAPNPASVTTNPSDRKSTRLNSSHVKTSYAVFCLKKKKQHRRL